MINRSVLDGCGCQVWSHLQVVFVNGAEYINNGRGRTICCDFEYICDLGHRDKNNGHECFSGHNAIITPFQLQGRDRDVATVLEIGCSDTCLSEKRRCSTVQNEKRRQSNEKFHTYYMRIWIESRSPTFPLQFQKRLHRQFLLDRLVPVAPSQPTGSF